MTRRTNKRITDAQITVIALWHHAVMLEEQFPNWQGLKFVWYSTLPLEDKAIIDRLEEAVNLTRKEMLKLHCYPSHE